ncbi:TELO2-interacting protein 1 homolog [Tetranychus urticae]|uniref:TELO2-interacting protein 1 homolog n=1 Tax=Tetranychus urticae TaxID=32264 RepID=T1JUV5_TETUR|nr:TELO2-interacting protein 1 homolog [Tetranychus urticae]
MFNPANSLNYQNPSDIFKKPLTLVLYKPEKWSEETLINTIDCMILMLQKGLVKSLDDLFELYAVLFNLIDIETNSYRGECKVSEDLKLHVVHCVKVIVDYLEENLVTEFLTKPALFPILGHSIHVLLNISLKEKYKELQMTSMACLNCLIKKIDCLERPNKVGPASADVLASFLPGISIAVMKIVLSDDKLPQKLYIDCLKTLETTIKAILSKPLSQNSTFDGKRPAFVIERTKDWLQSSCSKLEIIFDKIIKALLIKQSTLIKMQLLRFSQEMVYILAEIDVKDEIIITLLEVSFVIVSDKDKDLQESAQLWLQDFGNEILIHKPSLRDSLFEKFYQLLTTITRELQCISEDQKISKFKMIEGYFICLGPQGLTTFLSSQSCQNRLFTSLIDCAALDEKRSTHGYKLIEMLDLEKIESKNPACNYPDKSFKHFEDSEIQICFERICALLGQYLNSFGLIDYFSNILANGSKDPTIIYVCNYTLHGLQNVDILESLFNEYINQLSQLTEYSTARSTLAVSLLLEGISVFAEKYGSSKQYVILLNSLYLILANTGSDKVIISDSAFTTLQRLTRTFSYKSIKDLISENIDYILNYFNVKLKNFEFNRQVCPVFHAILNFTGLGILPYLEFTIDHVLSSLDIYYNLKCDVLVDLLKILISFIGKDISQTDYMMDSSLNYQSNEINRKENFIKQLQEFLEARKIVNSLEIEDDQESLPNNSNEANEDDDDDGKDEKKQLPVEISTTIKILERCCHLLSNPSLDIQIITMEIIMKGLRILKPWEDEILPLAHKLWTPILKRFNTGNLVLLTKCYHCLIVMSQCCGDFLKSRTLEQVIPRLISFLRSQYSKSFLKTDSSPYKYTLEYKLQCEVLRTIGLLCDYLKIESLSLWPVIEAVIPYLSNKQPRSLQQEALKSCKILIFLDPFAFHSYLQKMMETKEDNERKNYQTNLKILFDIRL